jgi:hypothetical protein
MKGLTETEKIAKEFWEKRGYKVLHSGWPDFFVFNDNHFYFLEVKRWKYGKMVGFNQSQKELLDALTKFNFDVKVAFFGRDRKTKEWFSNVKRYREIDFSPRKTANGKMIKEKCKQRIGKELPRQRLI